MANIGGTSTQPTYDTAFGTPKITIDYREPIVSQSFNRYLSNILRPGIYQGMEMSVVNTTTARVEVGKYWIQMYDLNGFILGVGVENNTTFNVSVSPTNPYVYMIYGWQNIANSYPEVRIAPDISAIQQDESDFDVQAVIIGKATFTLGNLTGFDYTERTRGAIDFDNANRLVERLNPTEDYHVINRRVWNYGRFHLGGIQYVMDNSSRTFSTYASNYIDEYGFALANGDPIPTGATLTTINGSSNRPNLMDSRFLMGSTASGTLSGVNGANNGDNTVSLTTTYMPTHNHGGVTGGNTANITGTSFSGISFSLPNGGGATGVAGPYIASSSVSDGIPRAVELTISGSISVTQSNHTHTIANDGSGTSFDIRPKYVSGIPLILVKDQPDAIV